MTPSPTSWILSRRRSETTSKWRPPGTRVEPPRSRGSSRSRSASPSSILGEPRLEGAGEPLERQEPDARGAPRGLAVRGRVVAPRGEEEAGAGGRGGGRRAGEGGGAGPDGPQQL